MTPSIRVRGNAPAICIRLDQARTKWRMALLVTASAFALSAHALPAMADDECGPAAGSPLTATCAVAVDNYPNGITYSETADVIINLDQAVVVARAAPGPGAGIDVSNTTGDVSINAPASAVSTTGDTLAGVLGRAQTGDVSVGAGDVTTSGDFSPAVAGVSGGSVSVTSPGVVSTTGRGAIGALGASLNNPVTMTLNDVSATGEQSSGVVAVSGAEADGGDEEEPVPLPVLPTVAVTVNGTVQGGWVETPSAIPLELPATLEADALRDDPFVQSPPQLASGVVIAGESALLINKGTIGALSDSAVVGYGQSITIDNLGAIVGTLTFPGEGDTTFNNLSANSLDLRSFADTDGDGVRDTESVAISDFGPGDDTFNNDAAGAVSLLNVAGATTIDPTGALTPNNVDPALYDVAIEGVEQGQLINLETFNNAGAIILQDALAGGAAPVAGDVLAIIGGEDGQAAFVSNGGSLYLDAVLDEGGAESLSDVLMAQTAVTGTGSTRVFVQNAGGLGAATVDDGILVVDVLNPEVSDADAFALGDYVIAGAYRYELFQGGDAATGGDPLNGDWYLRSDISPTVDAYRGYPAALLRFSNMSVGTLQQRVGNRWWRQPERQTTRTVTDPPLPPPPPPAAATRTFVVYFDFDRSNLNAAAQTTVREAAEYARGGNATRVEVVGHTDTSGATDYNQALSQRRAQAVSSALEAQGVAARVVQEEAVGEADPAVATGDGVREQRNRRVTVEVDTPSAGSNVAAAPAAPRTHTVTDVQPASTEIQGTGAWFRVVGLDGEYRDDNRRADESSWLVQGGVDFLVNQGAAGTTVAGFFLHYGEGSTDISTASFGDVASIDATGTGGGLTVTWYDPNGLYVDGVLSGTWYDSDIDSDALGALASGNEGAVWAGSVEVGKRFETSPNLYVVPQAQLTYSIADIDAFTDPFGASVDEDNSEALVGRFGVAFEFNRSGVSDGGAVTRTQAYGIANLYYDFLEAPGVEVQNIAFENQDDDFWGELGGGVSYSFNAAWTVYAEGSYRTSFENFGDSHVLTGDVGIRYNW